MPSLRGQDLVFGALLFFCVPGSLIGTIPRALQHSPVSTRAYAPQAALRRIGGVTGGEAAAFLIGSTALRGTRHDQRLAWMGDELVQISKMHSAEFLAQIYESAEPMLYAWYRQLESRVRCCAAGTSLGSEDAILLRDKVEEILRTRRIRTPSDLVAQAGPERGLSVLLSTLGKFGQLLQVWPELLETARQMTTD
jgi:hypothetical protein